MQGTSAVRRYRNVCMHVCNVMSSNVMQGKVSYVELCMYVNMYCNVMYIYPHICFIKYTYKYTNIYIYIHTEINIIYIYIYTNK